VVTGVGVPQITAIMDVANTLAKLRIDVPVIADGGIRHSGDIPKAIRCYQKTLEQNPNHVNSYFTLAMAYGQLGDTKRAIALYQRVIHLQPDFANAYNNLGCLLFGINDYDGALEAWEKSLIYNNIGQVFNAQGRIKEAIKSYHQALNIKDDFPLAYTNLGKILQQQNQHKNAKQAQQDTQRRNDTRRTLI
jgi:tetratricopeptide (TPR) repeat protein